MRKWIALLVGAGLVSLAFSASALGAPIVVNTDSDVGGAGAPCTLREAVESADGDGAGGNGCADGLGTDAISFDPAVFVPGGAPHTIDLGGSSQTLNLNSDLSIAGPGASKLIIDAAPGERTIFADVGNEITLSGLTVTGGERIGIGNDQGAGIYNQANLTLTGVTVSGNQVVREAPASSNVAAAGGGIYNSPTRTLTLNQSTVRGNTASATNPIGDVFGAEASGAGIYNEAGTLRVHGSVIDDNHAIAEDSGGASTVEAFGAGIRSTAGGSADIDHTQLTRNNAGASAVADGSTALAQGAGIAVDTGTITIEETTIAENAIAATLPGAGVIFQRGGGIYNGAATLSLISDTIARNGPSPAGVAANIANTGGTTNLTNTIVSDPQGAGSTNCGAGPETSGGFNVDYSAAGTPTCGLGVGELTTNPLLAAGLADNGGPTETIALQPASPAIDAGSNAGQGLPFLIEDQRGFLRPIDFTGLTNAANGTDIGAFEVQKDCTEQTTPSDACPQPVDSPVNLTVNPPVILAPPGATGRRAAALKKCKKKKSKKARKKCKRKARRLPV